MQVATGKFSYQFTAIASVKTSSPNLSQNSKNNVRRIAHRIRDAVLDEPLPHEKTIETDRWTEILFRALSNRVAKRWRFVSFRGPKKREFCGIVDVVAIRKDTSKSDHEVLRMGDLFEIILVQMKGALRRYLPLEIENGYAPWRSIITQRKWCSLSGTVEKTASSLSWMATHGSPQQP
jgi:hypothetical protein